MAGFSAQSAPSSAPEVFFEPVGRLSKLRRKLRSPAVVRILSRKLEQSFEIDGNSDDSVVDGRLPLSRLEFDERTDGQEGSKYARAGEAW